jgi:hypothetical protein
MMGIANDRALLWIAIRARARPQHDRGSRRYRADPAHIHQQHQHHLPAFGQLRRDPVDKPDVAAADPASNRNRPQLEWVMLSRAKVPRKSGRIESSTMLSATAAASSGCGGGTHGVSGSPQFCHTIRLITMKW